MVNSQSIEGNSISSAATPMLWLALAHYPSYQSTLCQSQQLKWDCIWVGV